MTSPGRDTCGFGTQSLHSSKDGVMQEITSNKWLVQCEDGSVRFHIADRIVMLMLAFFLATRGCLRER